MFDNVLRHFKDRLLDPLARPLPGINPLSITLIALTIGLTIQLISFLLDFTYTFIDPRVRERA